MILTFIIAFLSVIGLIIIHEFGHFLLAKKFKVRVEEFGIGYPPRLWGKKIGETLYSLNLIPFGAFVRLPGEIGGSEESGAFSPKPIWQRGLIIFGGALSFWLVAMVVLSILFAIGAPTVIEDEDTYNLKDAKVQITSVISNSPAEAAGLKPLDIIRELKADDAKLKTSKIGETAEFIKAHRGKEITMVIERSGETLEVKLTPRLVHPETEGPTGVGLIRTALKPYPLYEAPFRGVIATGEYTYRAIQGWALALGSALGVAKLPPGVKMELRGPVGVFDLLNQALLMGVSYFLQFLALISVLIALFNMLPIPAVDGGKLLFLGIEAIRKKPVSPKIEEKITTFFFLSLLALLVYITIQDVARLF